MKAKKIPYYLLLILLTMGASLILGFLSFGGMFVLLPILPLALGSFVLSVAYEGEIYLQNIKGSLNKLFFKREYLKHHLGNEYLLHHFPDTQDEQCPQFYKDYEAQLKLLHLFHGKQLDAGSSLKKRKIEKTLRNMEKWFTLQLFSTKKHENLSSYERAVREWLSQEGKQEELRQKLIKRQRTFNFVKLFSVVAATFMGLGTTYLLVEAFAAIPILAAISPALLPFFIAPMALIAGASYGFLTYNAITDMINHDTIKHWYNKISNYLSKGLTPRSLFIAFAAIILLTLAVALTVCTAGTWWTVVKNTPPLFSWMAKMPRFVMAIIHPIVTGLSSLVFNLQNTSESLEMIDEATKVKRGFLSRITKAIADGWANIRAKENWFQIFNPVRILIKLTYTPLRILFFLGHLVSIGVTSDRVPGVNEILSALLGIISEGFEDFHYFFEHSHSHEHHHHDHQHGHKLHALPHKKDHARQAWKSILEERLGSKHSHSHEMDIPSRLLKLLFTPLFALAALWDSWASQSNQDSSRNVLNFNQAWEKQTGKQSINSVSLEHCAKPSKHWQAHYAIYRIERFKEKHLNKVIMQQSIATEKMQGLNHLQEDLRTEDAEAVDSISEELKKPIYQRQRFFASKGKSKTEQFLEELSSQISPVA
nr:hypothetical protein [Legionella jordanis]